jgi:hypothetical protein
MLKSLLIPAFIVMVGALGTAGCTDNSGNGHYNPDAAAGGSGGGGGSGGDSGADGATDTPINSDSGIDLGADGTAADGASQG